jgi:hypothetical protein
LIANAIRARRERLDLEPRLLDAAACLFASARIRSLRGGFLFEPELLA